MKWLKKANAQTAQSNDYEVVIEKSRGFYWATCYQVSSYAKIKKFTFPPKKKIKALKELVEGNSLFEQIVDVKKMQPHSDHCSELAAEQWWHK